MPSAKISELTLLAQTDVDAVNDFLAIVDSGATATKKVTPKSLLGGSINDLAQTWNSAPTTFTGFKLNVTDTASAAASLLMDLQVGGTSKVRFGKMGRVSASNTVDNSNIFEAYNGSTLYWRVNSWSSMWLSSAGNGFLIGSTEGIGDKVFLDGQGGHGRFSGNLYLGGSAWSTPNAILFAPASYVLEQRFETNAQTFRIYNTYTDDSNYERATFKWNSNRFEIGLEEAGTGAQRTLRIYSDSLAWIDFNPYGGQLESGYGEAAYRNAIGLGADEMVLLCKDRVNIQNKNNTAAELRFSGYVNATILTHLIQPLKRNHGGQYTGAGHHLALAGGQGNDSSGAEDGGHLYLDGGPKVGSGADGDVIIGATRGTLRVGTHSAVGAETITGYITIKDAAGNTRKLAVIS